MTPFSTPYRTYTIQVATTAGMAADSALPMMSSLTSIGVASCGSRDRDVFSPMTDWVAIAIGTMAGMRRK